MIICVGGAHSRIGKTTLCSILLKELKGFGAIKFTKTRLYTSIIDDPRILNEPGKDTAILLGSGAQMVLWIQSPPEALGVALQTALSRMSHLEGIIVEGNSPVDFLNPHLVIFIVDAGGEIKPSALSVSKRADIIVINSKERVSNTLPFSPLTRGDRGCVFWSRGEIFWIDLQNKRGEIDKFLSYVKKRIKELH